MLWVNPAALHLFNCYRSVLDIWTSKMMLSHERQRWCHVGYVWWCWLFAMEQLVPCTAVCCKMVKQHKNQSCICLGLCHSYSYHEEQVLSHIKCTLQRQRNTLSLLHLQRSHYIVNISNLVEYHWPQSDHFYHTENMGNSTHVQNMGDLLNMGHSTHVQNMGDLLNMGHSTHVQNMGDVQNWTLPRKFSKFQFNQ